jgi:hypothetical protein
MARIKKVQKEEEEIKEEGPSQLELAIEITKGKIEKAKEKRFALDMDINSLELSLELLEREMGKE